MSSWFSSWSMTLQLGDHMTRKKKLSLHDFYPENLRVNKEISENRKVAYIFEEDMCNALWAAYANDRPLLLRGDPGTGKSELAFAIAVHLGWPLIKKVIQGNTELDDLFYRFDAVQRLADAQLYCGLDPAKKLKQLDVKNYITPGPIWWAFDWQGIVDDLEKQKSEEENPTVNPPASPSGWQPGDGCVLLIDEIDKADPDLPNGLLETFGNRCFEVRLLDGRIIHASQPVLTIITTNEERELPLPFRRRCLELELKLESDEKKRINWLVERGKLHYAGDIAPDIYEEAANLVWEERIQAKEQNRYQPGLAEYLDLLGSLSRAPTREQQDILDKISQFVLKKS